MLSVLLMIGEILGIFAILLGGLYLTVGLVVRIMARFKFYYFFIPAFDWHGHHWSGSSQSSHDSHHHDGNHIASHDHGHDFDAGDHHDSFDWFDDH